MGYVFNAYLSSMLFKRQARPFHAAPTRDDMEMIAELVESGTVVPVIDRTYPLVETREAFAYAVKGHARGKIVLTGFDTERPLTKPEMPAGSTARPGTDAEEGS
jgi:hypothetical protein